MTMGRNGATATLLLDGRVLIAGGDGYDEARSAELYDPKTGTFHKTGSLPAGDMVDTATLLLDGRVLIVVGAKWTSPSMSSWVASSSADLYDPRTGLFTRTGSRLVPLEGQTATLLLDGRVLMAGGRDDTDYRGSARAEIYDPKTGTFSKTGSMTTGHQFHSATLLRDGRVLIGGGNGDTSAELYDPATGTFRSIGNMDLSGAHTATLLNNGRILVVGEDLQSSPAADLYDPATGKFTPTSAPKGYIDGGDAPLLKDGRVLVPVQIDASGKNISTAELYDPITETFTQAGPMRASRFGFTDTLLADGRVLFAGDVRPGCAMVCPTMSPSEIAARASAELYVP